VDKVAEVFQKTWADLMTQGRAALDSGDGAHLLRVEGGRAVLMHVAGMLGYETKVEVKDDGQKESASGKPGREKKAKAAKGRRKSSIA